MPHEDPLPDPRLSLLVRFRRIMRWMALFSIAIAALAVAIVARGDTGVHIHMLIATALGAGLTVLLATALMTLAFLSRSSPSASESHSIRRSVQTLSVVSSGQRAANRPSMVRSDGSSEERVEMLPQNCLNSHWFTAFGLNAKMK